MQNNNNIIQQQQLAQNNNDAIQQQVLVQNQNQNNNDKIKEQLRKSIAQTNFQELKVLQLNIEDKQLNFDRKQQSDELITILEKMSLVANRVLKLVSALKKDEAGQVFVAELSDISSKLYQYISDVMYFKNSLYELCDLALEFAPYKDIRLDSIIEEIRA